MLTTYSLRSIQQKHKCIYAKILQSSRTLFATSNSRKLVDLSVPIENDVASDPPPFSPEVTYYNHKETFHQISPFFPGLKQEDLPNGDAWAIEKVDLITHNGTHLDAPYHFHPTTNNGERAKTIDEVPLEWCLGDGVKLDFRHFQDGHVVKEDDVRKELDRIEYQIKEFDIVVVNTSAGVTYGSNDYVQKGCGMGKEATLFLLNQGVKVTGTDAWSWDAPFVYTAKKYAETKDASLIWEGHKAGRFKEYCHLEKLHNLEVLPPHGFTICCFPIKIRGASAGWTRAVAML